MNIGQMRYRIEIQSYRDNTTSRGVEIKNWKTIIRAWAAVRNLYGKEFYEAAAVQMESAVVFYLRYQKGIDNSMHILFKNESYEIKSIDNIKFANKYLEIKAIKIEKESGENGL